MSMNQVLKDAVYNRGNNKQMEFLAKIGGMNEEESELLRLTHIGKSDSYIQDVMNVSRKGYERIVEAVRAKLLLSVFECINFYMDRYDD